MKKVYLDNAATTLCDKRVVDAMIPFYTDKYAVASSDFSHSPGIEAKEALDKAREDIANKIGAKFREVIFTSGATESNNVAINGIAMANKKKGNHIITSSVEHRSVKEAIEALEKEGFTVTWLPVSKGGFVSVDDLKKSIKKETLLVSIQHANQETGTVQDINSIGNICHKKSVFFHTDAALSFGRIPLDVKKAKVDLLSITAHKIHGPKGVGALYIRDGLGIVKCMYGGFNEFNKRAGTENIPGIVGFAKAIELIEPNEIKYIEKLKERLYDGIKKELDAVQLNGNQKDTLPTILNLTFRFVEGESVILHLDMRGIAVITGSACFSRSLEPSYVLKAMGLSHEEAHGSIRFSFSRFNKEDEIDYTIDAVVNVVKKLREISPITPDN
ncbi:cysteine desulfurase [candidate division WOR-3 bacterium]|nr:cysteine desulfurase [candidate division WOR-3 bacterium]